MNENYPVVFKTNGYEYTLLEHDKNICLYRGDKVVKDARSPAAVHNYEVHVLKWRKATTATMGGKLVTFKEGWYPGNNEDFGERAWSYLTLETAKKQYDHLKSTVR